MRKLNDLFNKDKVEKDKKQVEDKVDDSKAKSAEGEPKPVDEGDDKDKKIDAQDQQVDGGADDSDEYKEWSKDDLAEELKKTRQEAAKNRIAKKELEKELREEFDGKIKTLTEEFTPHVEKAKEFEKLKEKEEDKKRNLEEKLAHREAKIQELLAMNDDIKTSKEDQIKELQSQITKHKDDLGAYESYWTEQLEKELAEIPKNKRELADLMVKGAGNDQDALKAIKKAKTENLFGEKIVKVNHATPTAKEGARMGADKAQGTGKELSKNEKVKAGLTQWKDRQRSKI